MMQRALQARFGDTLKSRTSIDLACHQGYFSIALAELTQRVTGLDMNAESLADAARIMEAMGIGNVRLQPCNVQEIDTSKIEPADVVLMFGLIYHIEGPLRLLQCAAGWCKDTLLIETQLTPFELETKIEWGSHSHFRDVLGLYSLVDVQENRRRRDHPNCAGAVGQGAGRPPAAHRLFASRGAAPARQPYGTARSRPPRGHCSLQVAEWLTGPEGPWNFPFGPAGLNPCGLGQRRRPRGVLFL
jgi:Methyltransferase domain